MKKSTTEPKERERTFQLTLTQLKQLHYNNALQQFVETAEQNAELKSPALVPMAIALQKQMNMFLTEQQEGELKN